MEKIKVLRDGEEVEVTVAELIKESSEMQRIIQSETSKAKGDILKTLGVTSVEDAKARMGEKDKVTELSQEIEVLKKENAATRNKLYANEIGIKPELADRVITLANAAMEDGSDFKEVMKAEAEAIGALITQEKDKEKNPPQRRGVQKTKEQIDLEKAEAEEMARLAALDPMDR